MLIIKKVKDLLDANKLSQDLSEIIVEANSYKNLEDKADALNFIFILGVMLSSSSQYGHIHHFKDILNSYPDKVALDASNLSWEIVKKFSVDITKVNTKEFWEEYYAQNTHLMVGGVYDEETTWLNYSNKTKENPKDIFKPGFLLAQKMFEFILKKEAIGDGMLEIISLRAAYMSSYCSATFPLLETMLKDERLTNEIRMQHMDEFIASHTMFNPFILEKIKKIIEILDDEKFPKTERLSLQAFNSFAYFAQNLISSYSNEYNLVQIMVDTREMIDEIIPWVIKNVPNIRNTGYEHNVKDLMKVSRKLDKLFENMQNEDIKTTDSFVMKLSLDNVNIGRKFKGLKFVDVDTIRKIVRFLSGIHQSVFYSNVKVIGQIIDTQVVELNISYPDSVIPFEKRQVYQKEFSKSFVDMLKNMEGVVKRENNKAGTVVLDRQKVKIIEEHLIMSTLIDEKAEVLVKKIQKF